MLRGDLGEIHKITRARYKVNGHRLFPRAREVKLDGINLGFKRDRRGNIFIQRVTGIWSELLEDVVDVDTIAVLKIHLYW